MVRTESDMTQLRSPAKASYTRLLSKMFLQGHCCVSYEE